MKNSFSLLFILFCAFKTLGQSFCNASLKLDGSDDYGAIAFPFFQNLNQRDFTIEFYLKLDAQQTQYPGVWGKSGFWNEINIDLFLPGKLKFSYATSVGGQQYFNSDTVTWSPNHWDHYAIVGDQANNVLRIYKNGIIDASTPHGTPFWGLPNNDSKIGAVFQGWISPNIQYLNGRLDDFRVSNIPRYNGNFTPPQNFVSDSNTMVLYDFNNVVSGVISDLSGNSNNLTLHNGASLDFNDVPYGGIGSTSIFNYNSDTISSCGSIISVNATPNLGSYQWSNGDTTASTTVSASGWYILTVSNGNCSYTDSVYVSLLNAQIQQNDTTICSGATLTLSVAQPVIGQTPCNAAALPANLQNGLVGYWPFCGNANDMSGNGYNGLVNNAILSTDRFGNSSQSYWFNGLPISNLSSSKIRINTLNINNYISTGFSISYWFTREDSISSTKRHFAFYQYNGVNGLQVEYTLNSWRHSIRTSTANPPEINYFHNLSGIYNSWHQAVYIWAPPYLKTYIDGNLVNFQSNVGITNLVTGVPLDIGNGGVSGSYAHSGRLDDIGIWNRELTTNEILMLYNPGISNQQSYLWSTGDTTATINVNPTQTTSYWVQVSNGITTCTDTIHVTVSQPVVTISASPNDTLCTGQLLTLSGQGAASYVWSGGVSNGVAFLPGASGAYTVTGTDANGCTASSSIAITVSGLLAVNATATPATICAGASSTLSATGGTSYSWMPGNLTGSPSVSPATTTIYTVTATNASGCSNTATVTVNVNATPVVTTSANPATICAGASSTLSATGGTSYSWIPGNLTGSPSVSLTVTTTYTVTATNANGCTNTATITVNVNASPMVSTSATPSTICAGTSSTLSATGGTSYSWMPGNLTGIPSVTPTATTTYTVTATNANGCTNTATVTVNYCSNSQLTVKVLHQGYYKAAGSIGSVLQNQGQPNGPSDCDTVEIRLYNASAPYAMAYSYKGILQTNGNIVCSFPPAVNGLSFYIGVRHRNAIETWSNNPVLMSAVTNYNFSNAQNKAYGSNQMSLGGGFYAIFNGDINQDGVVDGLDYNDWETDNNNFAGGYYNSDLNGDGIVDGLDFLIWEDNNNNFVGIVTP
jgi:hypothetical protein